jgi:hypothetical protein
MVVLAVTRGSFELSLAGPARDELRRSQHPCLILPHNPGDHCVTTAGHLASGLCLRGCLGMPSAMFSVCLPGVTLCGVRG